MKVERTIAGVRSALSEGRGIGFVPTMGALHAGHLALMERARAESETLAVSIFVNPLQFGASEDLGAYPRDEEGDLQKCADAGADLVFVPSVEEMYGDDRATRVVVDRITEVLEGAARPGHFDAVAELTGGDLVRRSERTTGSRSAVATRTSTTPSASTRGPCIERCRKGFKS